jgi:hypothetical protein
MRTVQPILTGSLRLEASSACQLRCPSCPTTTGAAEAAVGKNFLRLPDFVTLIDDNPWIGEIELSNYGEVFLNPELLGIFEHAYNRNVTLKIQNGANLNHVADDVLEGLVRYQVAIVTCSIDGASQETYARYRVRGNYYQVIDNVRRIGAYKKAHVSPFPRLVWQFIAFGHNEHEIPAARALAEELGMKFYVKLNWDGDFSPVRNEALIRQAAGAASRQEFEAKTGKDYTRGICAQLWSDPQVNWDGKLLGCCRNFWGDFGGNAFGDGLVASLNHEKMRYARQMLTGFAPPREDIPCATCDLYLKRIAANDWIAAPEPLAGGELDAVRQTWSGALALLRQEKLSEAAPLARIVLQLEPGHAGALCLLGEVAARAGRDKAARYYREKAKTGATTSV